MSTLLYRLGKSAFAHPFRFLGAWLVLVAVIVGSLAVNAPKVSNEVSINGVEYTGTDTGRAGVRVVFGSNSAQNGIVTSKGASRQTAVVIGNFTVPAADRGQLRYIGVQGYQTAGAGLFQLDYQSAVVYDWEFVERPA